MDSFNRELHVRSLLAMLEDMPSGYQEQENHRLTLAYFAISGLDILNALDQVDAKKVTNWVYHLQILPSDKEDKNGFFYGFQGSSAHILKDMDGVNFNNGGHLASTYSALSILRIMGDDLAQLDKKILLKSMKNLQQFDGSFTPLHTGAETDLRFVFCAAAICFMLNDWSGMDMHKALGYILSCQSYDGGFGLSPGLESHGLHVDPNALASILENRGNATLCLLLLKCLMQVASSSSAERNWSTYSFIYSVKRNRLGAKRAEDLLYVQSYLRLLSHKDPKYNVGETRNWDLAPECADLDATVGQLAQVSIEEAATELERDLASGSDIPFDSGSIDAGFEPLDDLGLGLYGGATYCAIATLKLMGYITDDPVSKRPTSSIVDLSSVVEWSLQKQTLDGGFQGRSNKASDTCYSFWVGGSLKLLGAHDFYDWEALRCFLFTCQSKYGGFSKWPAMFPDLYHSYYGLCGFSLLEEPELAPLCYELGITQKAALYSQITKGIC
ncbi:geranylgeranyl transferase type-1 subunit beta [Cryptomeria japonica]|uniref:geranylgeranyl transferase type-1 subunit beta n=1 Tax=Cryptomeria japonica TaxID=3369 RepID=UPI0027DA31E0|nr:geranylgeranyl transferase type-1 subunit beta [Cryptomeria japonica]